MELVIDNENQQRGAATPAENILQAAEQIGALSKLYFFIRATQQGEHPEAGRGAQLVLADRQQTNIFINTNLILAELQSQFEQIGKNLEANNVDLGNLMAELNKRFEQQYEGK